jgi:hypothetical protein
VSERRRRHLLQQGDVHVFEDLGLVQPFMPRIVAARRRFSTADTSVA